MFLQPLRAVRTLTTPYVGFGVDLGPAPCTQRVVVGTLGKPKMVHRSKFERRLRVALGPRGGKGTLWGYSEVLTNGCYWVSEPNLWRALLRAIPSEHDPRGTLLGGVRMYIQP